ncbi:MAG: RIP metalloprotease RseP [Candidatus Sumerlaeota bacterium]|nr:RIP metalloprotease RseP [Candidatus Sumerlaeota bacterium]
MEWLLNGWNLATATAAGEPITVVSILLSAWYWAQVVLMFAVVIVIHELGHFVFAKMFGVKVESFNVGFGSKRLWSKRIGETEYSIRPWPLGGFVQLHGRFRPEEMAELEGTPAEGGKDTAKDSKDGKDSKGTEKSGGDAAKDAAQDAAKTGGKRSVAEMTYDDARALREKPYPVKVLVFSGGVLFNFVSVALMFSAMFMFGKARQLPQPAWLNDIPTTSPLYQAGLRGYDRVIELNGEKINRDYELLYRLDLLKKDKDAKYLTLKIGRIGRPLADDPTTGSAETTMTIQLPNDSSLIDAIEKTDIFHTVIVGQALPDSPAAMAQIKDKDRILAINGQLIRSRAEMIQTISANPEKEITLSILRGAQRLKIPVVPKKVVETDGAKVGRIGVNVEQGDYEFIRTSNPVRALSLGFSEAWDSLAKQTSALGKLFGKMKMKEIHQNVAGPVGILSMGHQSAEMGFGYLLDFLGLLSIALVIFNILPIPLLDGGHIVQATIEVVIRRPIPMRVLIWVYNGALFLLAAFVLWVTAGDLMRVGRQWGKNPDAQPPAAVSPAPAAKPTSATLEVTSGSGVAVQPAK